MGKIVWLTGLSGAGKSTLALKLKKKLLNKKKTLRIKIIDGDLFRKKNKLKNTFTKKNDPLSFLNLPTYKKSVLKLFFMLAL